jgi:hypothetical protein
MTHVTAALDELLDELRANRDSEVATLAEVLPQYVTDHNDREAYKDIDRRVNALAQVWDKMIALLERTSKRAAEIEASVDSFYGD